MPARVYPALGVEFRFYQQKQCEGLERHGNRDNRIICTYNGARHLAKTIESLVDQSMPEENYEIIIVDNCSTDSTKEVIDRFAKAKNIRYIYESTLGLSFARNAGWRNARGKYAAYLDDDGEASRTWLEKIVEAFESIKPRPGCIGGKVEPIWEAPRPSWLSDELLSFLTIINWSDTPRFLHDLSQEFLVGTNIAIPVKVLEEVGVSRQASTGWAGIFSLMEICFCRNTS